MAGASKTTSAAYLEAHHQLAADTALHQTVRGNNDYGIDGYTLDGATGNLYLYQFKYSTDWRQFQESMRRLIKAGLAKVFSATPLDLAENTTLRSLRAEIDEFKPTIRSVYVRFVFTGNPKRAEESDTLKDLQEQIEDRHTPDLVDEFGGDLRMPGKFRDRLLKIGMRQVKPTLLWLVQQKEFSEAYKEERYEFLRSDKAFNRSMSHTLQAYGWRQTRLGRPLPTGPRASRKVGAA